MVETHPHDGLLAIGGDFKGYRILAKLGSGSFGTVYKARKLSTGQLAAIKVLRDPEEGSGKDVQRQRERFRREMYLCAHLSHPHVVRLIDHSEESDRVLFAAFDYLSGDTLEKVLAEEGTLAPREAIRLMGQVLDALACAHERSIVHRDLKPANIMITKTGARRNAMVLDFGLGGFAEGRHREAATRLTMSRELLGTPAYAAPEQLRGEAPTARCDLYSWGLILLECLTGQWVFEGISLEELIHRQLGADPLPIPEAIASGPLGPLIATVTAKDPLQRERSAANVLSVLESLTPDAVLAVSPPDPRMETRALPSLDVLAHVPRERRQVTVLSCRLRVLGTDGLPPDSEETDRLLRLHFATCRSLVKRGGGMVCGIVGSRILAVFGYPRAQEDAARRAARAALSLVDELQISPVHAGGEGNASVEVHVGIHAGVEIVPVPSPELEVGAGLALGPTIDLATGLDALAGPGEILLSEPLALLLRGSPSTFSLGPRTMAVVGRELLVYRLAADGEGAPAPAEAEAEMFGRARELAVLEQTWAEAEDGLPRVLWMRGEAGIGKSRLLRELHRRVRQGTWLLCRCSPDAQDSPLQPIAAALTALLRNENIDTWLRGYGLNADVGTPVFCSLLGAPLPPGHAALEVGPQKRKELTFTCLLELFVRMAESRPLAFMVEDLHWSDPTTRELMERLVEEVLTWRVGGNEPLRLCVLLSSRPDLEPWHALREVPTLQLGSLTSDEARQMTLSLLPGEASVSSGLVEIVVRRAEGVPLFIEEVARMMRTPSGFAGPASALEIPTNLRDLLAARLDRLSALAKATVQRAAFLGREFRLEMLAALSSGSIAELRSHLDELIAHGLVLRRRGRQDGGFVFKHGLVRDAAYESVPLDRRRHIHETIARTLAERFPEQGAARPDLLGHHFQEAGLTVEAIRWWNEAARLARSHWANEEASRHWQRCVDLLNGLPDDVERRQEELRVQRRLGNALMTIHGYASDRVARCFERARELCEQLGDTEGLSLALNGLWGFHLVRGDAGRTRDLAHRQVELATRTGRVAYEMAGAHAAGVTAFYAGDLRSAAEYLERALELYRKLDAADLGRLLSLAQSPSGIPCYVAWCDVLSGEPERGVAVLDSTLEQARKFGNPWVLAEALNHGIAVWHDLGEPERVRELAEEVIGIANQHGFGLWEPVAQSARGWARVLAGDTNEGLRELAQGIAAYRATGARNPLAYRHAYWVEALLAAGRLEEGIRLVHESLAEFRGHLDRFYDAELHRLEGELLRRRGADDDAAACFGTALETARAQGAGWLELRALLSAARLARDRGDGATARELLEPALGRFPERLPFDDLRAARALLGTLA